MVEDSSLFGKEKILIDLPGQKSNILKKEEKNNFCLIEDSEPGPLYQSFLNSTKSNSEEKNSSPIKSNKNVTPFLDNKQPQQIHSRIEKPRDYQLQIFEKIKDRGTNSIVFLETGKGKTFISIMLIKHLLGLDINKTYETTNKKATGKKIVFLVCEVVLVEQQSVVIRQNTPLLVKACSGKNMKSMKKDPITFRQSWANFDVFVATPQVIYQLLSTGYLKISDIDLLIFDECHHADGNHPYNLLMNEFYFYYLTKEVLEVNEEELNLPQILGLTASPLKKKTGKNVQEDAQKALRQICENLNAVMVIDPEVQFFEQTEGTDGVYNLSKDEAIREYIEVTEHTQNENFLKIKNFLMDNLFTPFTDLCFECSDPENKPLKEEYLNYLEQKFSSPDFLEFNKVLSTYKYLYELRKKSGLFSLYEKIQRQMFMLIENIDLDSIIHLLHDYSIHLKNFLSKGIIDDYQDFNDYTKDNVKLLTKIIDDTLIKLKLLKSKCHLEYESLRLKGLKNKITELIEEEISSNSTDDFKIIIFVNNRIVAEILTKIINSHISLYSNKNKNYLAVSVVGVNKRKSEGAINPSNSITTLNENIEKFKNGTAQILVGTNTVEEGLDVKTCNIVMVYTELRTAKSYIQMKGRARKIGAKFLVFTPNKHKTISNIEDFVNLTICMRNLFEEDNIAKDFRRIDYFLNEKKLNYEHYFVSKTHAKFTLKNVAVFYNEFIQILKTDKNTKQVTSVVKYNEYREFRVNGMTTVFEAVLTFSCNHNKYRFPNHMCCITSDKFIDKASAESHCFVNFFRKAHEQRIVDDYFKFVLK